MNPMRTADPRMPSSAVDLLPTRCAICGSEGNATELYPANFGSEAFDPAVFSARRLPDRTHYRQVKCRQCGLVRSDPVAPPELITHLYARSAVTYWNEIADLKQTYGRYLARLEEFGAAKDALLEIGCGNGFFLEQAREQGYRSVRGVEPSQEAVASAGDLVREQIVCDVMRPGLFEPDQFDVVCLFQVFDHIAEPGVLLDECLRVLKPGGFVLAINHNVEAISAKLLGERSPIIDIEHTFLYSPATMSQIFREHGFEVRRVGSVHNRYSMRYLTRLLPLPDVLKRPLLGWLEGHAVGALRLSVPLGNLHLVAQRPRR